MSTSGALFRSKSRNFIPTPTPLLLDSSTLISLSPNKALCSLVSRLLFLKSCLQAAALTTRLRCRRRNTTYTASMHSPAAALRKYVQRASKKQNKESANCVLDSGTVGVNPRTVGRGYCSQQPTSRRQSSAASGEHAEPVLPTRFR